MNAPLSPERLAEIAAGVSLPDRDDLRKLVADALSQHPNGWGVNRVLDLVDSVLTGATKQSDADHLAAYRLLAEGFNERGAEVERLAARVAELEAERHATNEALSEATEKVAGYAARLSSASDRMEQATEAIQADGRHIKELTAQVAAVRAFAVSHEYRWLLELLDGGAL